MPKILWDQTGERTYETGVDHGVLYIPTAGKYNNGVAWNGLVSINESPSGAEPNAQYADNIKYLNLISAEEFSATIEAFTYPEEFAQFDGTATPIAGVYFGQQTRKSFGLSYRTIKGNDTDGTSYGYKLHLLYGCSAAPSEKSYSTVNDSPEAITFSWELSTTPIAVNKPNAKPVSLITIDSTKVEAAKMKLIEDKLYGVDGAGGAAPSLPTPDELLTLLGGTVNPSEPSPDDTTPGEGETPVVTPAFVVTETADGKLTSKDATVTEFGALTGNVITTPGGKLAAA